MIKLFWRQKKPAKESKFQWQWLQPLLFQCQVQAFSLPKLGFRVDPLGSLLPFFFLNKAAFAWLHHIHILSVILFSFSFPSIVAFSTLSLHCLGGKMEHSNNREKIKSTILHHLFQKQRQSPYYDNLCRPVSDLLPFIANGIRGVTTNPAVLPLFCITFYVIFSSFFVYCF